MALGEILYEKTRNFTSEHAIESCDFGQRILFSDSCQLTITWMFNWCIIYVLGLLARKCDISHSLCHAAPLYVKWVPCSLNANQPVWKEGSDLNLPPSVTMSQYTLKGSPEAVGSIQYSPSPWASPLSKMSLQEVPGTKALEPFFAARKQWSNLKQIGWTTWDSAPLRSVTIDSQRRFGSCMSAVYHLKKKITLLKKCSRWYFLITRKGEWVVPFETLFKK